LIVVAHEIGRTVDITIRTDEIPTAVNANHVHARTSGD
jgi:hypothetical protein